MEFNTVVEQIIDRITGCSDIPGDRVRSALNVYKDSKSDFSMFFNNISQNPEGDARALFKSLEQKNFPEIVDLSVHESQISFNLNKKLYFEDILRTVHSKNAEFGKSSVGHKKTIIVEYSSPNIAKVFHVGHYRTTILGNFIKNLLNNAGYNTVSMNYLGDWGKQFGLVLLGFERFGSEEELKSDALMHLFRVYVKINEVARIDSTVHDEARAIFREMEECKNEKYLSRWRLFREMSVERYKMLYKKLNVEFDVYSGESFYRDVAKEFAHATTIGKTDDDGSKVVDCGPYGKALIQKSDGTTLYLTRDICAAVDRIGKYKPHKIIYVVSSEQDQHLQQLFYCMEKLGYDKNIFEHVNYGYVKGMSTRSGTVHLIEDIIESSSNAIRERLLSNKDICDKDRDETALVLAISTLLVADFGAKRIKGYTFSAEQRANCEKGSGAYLQYAHCRLNSIEEINNSIDMADISDVDFSLIDFPEIHGLSYKLLWYERILDLCLEDYEPSRLVVYLMDLAKTVNNLVARLRVKGEESSVAKARLLVLSASRKVIRNGLEVLGMTPLNKM